MDLVDDQLTQYSQHTHLQICWSLVHGKLEDAALNKLSLLSQVPRGAAWS